MNKAELIKKIAESTGGKAHEVERMLNSLGDVAAAELLGGGEVTFPKLGKLVVLETAARQARNPKTGEAVQVAAGKKVKFRACKDLKDALKND